MAAGVAPVIVGQFQLRDPVRPGELLEQKPDPPRAVHGEAGVLDVGDGADVIRPGLAPVSRGPHVHSPVGASEAANAVAPSDPHGAGVPGMHRDRQVGAEALLAHDVVEHDGPVRRDALADVVVTGVDEPAERDSRTAPGVVPADNHVEGDVGI